MSQKWNSISKRLVVDERKMCGYCKVNTSDELAHALIHRRNVPKKKQKPIHAEENACPCCKECQPLSETREGRLIAWEYLCNKFGYSHMREWYDNLPLLVKEEMP